MIKNNLFFNVKKPRRCTVNL